MSRRQFRRFLKSPNNILILHYGYYWENVEKILDLSKCKFYMKYHNITPSIFFKKYSNTLFNMAEEGIKQLDRIIKKKIINNFMTDSVYNAKDFETFGLKNEDINILAPFHRIDDLANTEINIKLLEELLDGKINILFVGRITPNKGHKHLIETIKKYVDLYGRNIRLTMVGGLDQNLNDYYIELIKTINSYNLSDIIYIKQGVSLSDLHTYYLGSHIFLLMSEHEGFCVPILEAQYHKLPIIALDKCAMSYILGKEQLIIKDLDYNLFAAAINVITNDNDARLYLIENGYLNYMKYETSKLENDFIKVLFNGSM